MQNIANELIPILQALEPAIKVAKPRTYTIYKIYCIGTNLVYIGSTYQTLCDRFTSHKSAYSRGKGTSANIIFDYAYNNHKFARVEAIDTCTDNHTAVAIEKAQILKYRETDSCVNKRLPNPELVGTGSVGTVEYRKSYNAERKRKALIEGHAI